MTAGPSQVHDIRSNVDGTTFRIFTAACGQDPEATLVLTDANGLFDMATDLVRLMQIPGLVPPMTVVGVGYPDASVLLDTIADRARDLTPTRVPTFNRSGGATALADFLEHQLLPHVAERQHNEVSDTIYFGHSLGGLFGTHTLLTRPNLFNRYILSSPSLWWDNNYLFDLEEEYASRQTDLAASACFSIGSLETDAGRRQEARNLPDGHVFKPPMKALDMVADLRRFTTSLGGRCYPSLELHTMEFADEFHATVPSLALTHGLRRFFA